MNPVSTIGAGTTVRGSIRGEGDLEIHGHVEGVVVVTGEVLITETALLKSDVRARRITVRGAVAGDVSADEAIVLEPGARVLGDLGAPQIGIRPGAMVRGNVSTGGPLPETKSASTAASAPAANTRSARAAAAPVARLAPARAATPAPAARPVAAARPAPAAARTAPPVRTAPVSIARPEPPASVPRGDLAPSAAVAAKAPADEHEHEADVDAEESEATEGGPPPPVVPALRKGAKASLRRKGAQ
jgi:cytoskeletal protein CcmA (bactofilin family)